MAHVSQFKSGITHKVCSANINPAKKKKPGSTLFQQLAHDSLSSAQAAINVQIAAKKDK